MKKIIASIMVCCMVACCAMAALGERAQARELDVSRVKVTKFTEDLVSSDGKVMGEVTFEVVGVVFFDPNTFEVSEVRKLIVQNMATTVTGSFVSGVNSRTSFGKYEGTIDVTLDVSVDKVSGEKFAPVEVTLTVNGDE